MQQDYTHISIVLDRSGSMLDVATDTIGGFNTFLAEQKKSPGRATITLTQFDTIFKTVMNGVDIQNAKSLTSATFVPRGMTALLDAVAHCLERTGDWLKAMPEAERPAKVIFVIITDGLENASRFHTPEAVAAKIAHQRDVYQWQFVFLGANQDAFTVAEHYNIPIGNAMTYAANGVGTSSAFADLSMNTLRYRAGSKKSMDWTDSQKDKQKRQAHESK